MADDIGALLTHLDLPKVDVMGYSLGVAIQTGVRHRDRVRKLVATVEPWLAPVTRNMVHSAGARVDDNLGMRLL